MPLLYQRHFGKGTIVSLYCCFSGHQEGTKSHISLEAQKKREPPFSRAVPENVFGFLWPNEHSACLCQLRKVFLDELPVILHHTVRFLPQMALLNDFVVCHIRNLFHVVTKYTLMLEISTCCIGIGWFIWGWFIFSLHAVAHREIIRDAYHRIPETNYLLKYRFSRPSNAFPCLASSRAISSKPALKLGFAYNFLQLIYNFEALPCNSLTPLYYFEELFERFHSNAWHSHIFVT